MERARRFDVRSAVTAAMCAAVFAVLSQIMIPMPSGMPLTLQTFAAALCGCVLYARWGTAATAAYLLLGAVGLPVFAGFRGGFAVLIGPTGGFLWGFLPLTLLCGMGAAKAKQRPIAPFLFGISGLLLCHMAGTAQFALLTERPLWQAFWLASAPYLIKDMLSVLGAFLVARYFRKRRVIV